jgi:hypothetical protein
MPRTPLKMSTNTPAMTIGWTTVQPMPRTERV